MLVTILSPDPWDVQRVEHRDRDTSVRRMPIRDVHPEVAMGHSPPKELVSGQRLARSQDSQKSCDSLPSGMSSKSWEQLVTASVARNISAN